MGARINPAWIVLGAAAAILGIVLLLSAPPLRTAPPKNSQEASVGSFLDKANNRLELIVQGERDLYSVAGDARSILPALMPDDTVWFVFGDAKAGQRAITFLAVKRAEIALRQSAGAVLLAFALIWGVILVVTKGHPWAFALGLDLRLSNSHTQLYLWFLLLSTIYLAEFGLRTCLTGYFGGIGIPNKLLALAGVSALTFGAARANTTYKAAEKRPQHDERDRWEHFKELLTNDAGQFDLGDFQMIALTAAAILIYLVTSLLVLRTLVFATHVDLPGVDDALLGGTSAGQGVYLLKKFASPAGDAARPKARRQ